MIDLVTDGLATHRLARLVASDVITADARDTLIRYLYAKRGDRQARILAPEHATDWTQRALDDGPDAPKLATLIVCRWCAGFWLALGVVAVRRVAPRAWAPLADVLACSSVAGLLGVWEHFTEPQKVEIEEAED